MTVIQTGFNEKITKFLKTFVESINTFLESLCDDHHCDIIPFDVVPYNLNGRNGKLHFIVIRPCAYYSGTDIPYALHVHPYVNFMYVDHDPETKIRDLMNHLSEKFREDFKDGLFGYDFTTEKVSESDFYKIQFKYLDIEFGNRYYWAR